jgi:diacylglycerol kinase (ATP)
VSKRKDLRTAFRDPIGGITSEINSGIRFEGIFGAVGIALFCNPLSRRNRLHPEGIETLRRAIGNTGEVLTPTPEELPSTARRLAENPPSLLAIHGGDGTVHATLSQLLPAFGDKPLPPLALLTGGTMNVVPRSLGLVDDPARFATKLAEGFRQGRSPITIPRRCLQIGEHFGFVFANGVFATFLEEYYRTGSYGHARATWLVARIAVSTLLGGRYRRQILRPFRGRVTVDGELLDPESFTAISAATVAQVGMGFKLNHRADEDLNRMSVVAARALPNLWDIISVARGKGMSQRRASTHLAAQMRLAPQNETMSYTIDGDMYRTENELVIQTGPLLQLICPNPPVALASKSTP